VGEDLGMLELRLRSGEIVAFDGRILEVFAPSGAVERLHIVHGEATRAALARLHFAREEAPARARLLAAIEQAQQADG
jgi:hypothetical protein